MSGYLLVIAAVIRFCPEVPIPYRFMGENGVLWVSSAVNFGTSQLFALACA